MPLIEPRQFTLDELFLDVTLSTKVSSSNGGEATEYDLTGRKLFETGFFRENIGFGITNIEIEVNASLQPLVVITFKDLYGKSIYGNQNSLIPNESKYSILFNWPPPKFAFKFKGYLGKPVTWLLNLKKIDTDLVASDGSFEIKATFVPNIWGFFADLPFLFLLAVKYLKKNGQSAETVKNDTIFDLIKIGKQVDVKTKETTKEFDLVLKQMTLIKSQKIIDAVLYNKIIKLGEEITGSVGATTIGNFNKVLLKDPTKEGLTSIDSEEKIKSIASSPDGIRALNSYAIYTADIGPELGQTNYSFDTFKDNYLKDSSIVNTNNRKLKLIQKNIDEIEKNIQAKAYKSSKKQIEKLTIGEIFKTISKDSGFIMGKILQAGQECFDSQNKNPQFATERRANDKLIGLNFPLWIDSEGEEVPATKENTGLDFGVDEHEMKFVEEFINALSEGIAQDLSQESQDAQLEGMNGENTLKKRINNLEMLQGNPYKPYYQNIAQNIIIRSGIAAFLTHSDDPNFPGEYGNDFWQDLGTELFGQVNSTKDGIEKLAEADFENLTESIIQELPEEDFLKLKDFCKFWINFYTDNGRELLDINAKKFISLDTELPMTFPYTVPDNIWNYPVMIEAPTSTNNRIETTGFDINAMIAIKGSAQNNGYKIKTLREIASDVFPNLNRFNSNSGGTIDNAFSDSNEYLINIASLTAKKLLNNNLLYYIPDPTETYTYVMFQGDDFSKSQEVNQTSTDSELQNRKRKAKSKEPLGVVSIDKYFNEDGDVLPEINRLNTKISDNKVLSYTNIKQKNPSFFTNKNVTPDDINRFNVTQQIGNPDNLQQTEIAASNISYTVCFDSFNANGYVFGPFIGGNDVGGVTALGKYSRLQRVFIKSFCKRLNDRVKKVEENRRQVISDVLGNASEQRNAIYKQMHNLYQQWEILLQEIPSERSSSNIASGLESMFYHHTTSDSEVSNAIRSSKDIDSFFQTKNGNTTESNIGSNFIYDYPLQTINSKKINVQNSIINIEPLYSPNGDTSVLNAIQQVCTKNNFIFIPIPGMTTFGDISQAFEPFPSGGEISPRNFFHVMFMPTPESRAKISNDKSELELYTSQDIKNLIQADAFWIKYGSPENQIVSNVSVDTYNSKTTAESVINLQRLVDNENQNKKVTTDCSMLPVLEGRSYKANCDILGNAQVYPLQFFYLDTAPLFSGLYQIMKVRHNITPNDMKTNFEGIRMRYSPTDNHYGGIEPVTLESLDEISKEVDKGTVFNPITDLENTQDIDIPQEYENMDNPIAYENGVPVTPSKNPLDSQYGIYYGPSFGYLDQKRYDLIRSSPQRKDIADAMLALPMPLWTKPVSSGSISSLFGIRRITRSNKEVIEFHMGIDVLNTLPRERRKEGKILAASSGKVILVRSNEPNAVINKTTEATAIGLGPRGGYGNTVVIKHNDRFYTQYSHLDSVLVSPGDLVTVGQPVGYMGNTGGSFGAHLHFEIWDATLTKNVPIAYVNPQKYIYGGISKDKRF